MRSLLCIRHNVVNFHNRTLDAGSSPSFAGLIQEGSVMSETEKEARWERRGSTSAAVPCPSSAGDVVVHKVLEL